MFTINKSIKKIMGTPRKKGKDSDGDRVFDRIDYQPFNTMKQDSNSVKKRYDSMKHPTNPELFWSSKSNTLVKFIRSPYSK